jgi:hypothetical protein
MASVEWREYEGMPYLYCDYSGTDEAGLLEVLHLSAAAAAAAEPGLAVLVNVTDTPFSTRYLREVKVASAQVLGPQRAVITVFGLSGMQSTMLRGYNAVGGGAKAVPFRDEASSLRWLRAHAGR